MVQIVTKVVTKDVYAVGAAQSSTNIKTLRKR